MIITSVLLAHPCPETNIDPSSGVCFLLHPDNTQMEYAAAKTACENINMEIAIIDTSEKQAFINSNNLVSGVKGYAFYMKLKKHNFQNLMNL